MIKLGICPHCCSAIDLAAIAEDNAHRELAAILRDFPAASLLVAYLGLFKPRKQALRASRAVELARQTIELLNQRPASTQASALCAVLGAMDSKRQEGNWKPLTGHNYLLRVLETTTENKALSIGYESSAQVKQSATKSTIDRLLGKSQ